MLTSFHTNHPLDLLSHPLSYIYFSLVDHYIHYIKHSPTLLTSKAFSRKLQAFLFLYENNPNNINKLNKLIFSNPIPFESIASSQIYHLELSQNPTGAKYFVACKYRLNLPLLHRTYSKQFIRLKKHGHLDQIDILNSTFIQLHKRLINASFPSQEHLPPLVRANNAETFLEEVKKLLSECKTTV